MLALNQAGEYYHRSLCLQPRPNTVPIQANQSSAHFNSENIPFQQGSSFLDEVHPIAR